jgi:hypothetical protein
MTDDHSYSRGILPSSLGRTAAQRPGMRGAPQHVGCQVDLAVTCQVPHNADARDARLWCLGSQRRGTPRAPTMAASQVSSEAGPDPGWEPRSTARRLANVSPRIVRGPHAGSPHTSMHARRPDTALPAAEKCHGYRRPGRALAFPLVCPVSGSRMAGRRPSAPGRLCTRSPAAAGKYDQEPTGAPTCPRTPCEDRPRSETPVLSSTLALACPGRRPSAAWNASANPAMPLRAILMNHDYPAVAAPSRGLSPRSPALCASMTG